MKKYSRRANVEEKKNIRSAYLYVVLSIVAVVFLFFLGLPTLIKFAAFFTEIGKSDAPVDKNDITPPAPPFIQQNTENTNKKEFKLSGTSESGAVVKLFFNSEEIEAVANSDGEFSFDLNLKKGDNTFKAEARDQAGNVSQQTEVYKVNYDDEAPDLKVESPSDNSTYYGSGQRQIEIKGVTANDAEVFVNERFVSVSDEATFSYSTSLNEGENTFEIKAKDAAGNETKANLILNFSL